MGMLRITWKKSDIGFERNQKATIKSLGLRRLHQTVERPNTAIVRGQIFKVRHMIVVEEIKD